MKNINSKLFWKIYYQTASYLELELETTYFLKSILKSQIKLYLRSQLYLQLRENSNLHLKNGI
jgi:hypothetical protein